MTPAGAKLMRNKVLIMLTSGPDTPTRLETPFSQALTALALNAEEVTLLFTMDGTRLLEKGVADRIQVSQQADQNVYETIQLVKECGAKMYVCPSSLQLHGLTMEDCIPELDGAMGSTGFTSLGMQDDVVVFCY